MKNAAGSGRTFGLVAVACVVLFVTVVVTLPFVQGQRYDVVSQTISELALGRLGWLMNLAFVVLGAGTAALALAIRAAVPGATWTPRLLLAAAPLDAVSATFHAVLMGQPMTRASLVHVGAGILTWILTIAAMFSAVRPFRRDPRWRSFARPTVLWAWTSASCMLVLGPNVLGQQHFGVGQRITAATFTLWMLVASARAALLTRQTGRGTAAERPSRRNVRFAR